MNAFEYARSNSKAVVAMLDGDTMPTLEDLEKAEKLAKDSHEVLKAARTLLSKGIREVCAAGEEHEKPAPGEPLFEESGEPAPAADLTRPALSMAAPVIDAEIVHEPTDEEKGEFFSGLLEAWEGMGFEDQGGSLKEFRDLKQGWWIAFGENRDAMIELLRWAVETSTPWGTPQELLERYGKAMEEADAIDVEAEDPGFIEVQLTGEEVAEVVEVAQAYAEERGEA